LAFLSSGGESIHNRKWLTYFIGKGYDVHLITFTGAPLKGLNIHKVRYFSKFAYPFRILEIRKAVKQINPDILHAYYVSYYGAYGALTDFKPLVVTALGSDVLIEPKKSIAKRYLVKYVLRKADLITADSNSAITAILGFGVDREKVKLIGHGVDLKVFHPIENKEDLKEELCVERNYQVVISTRSLRPIYDVGTLIKSIPYVIDECPNTCFLIVGEGTLRHQLEELAHKLGVAKNVRFVGSVPNMEMPKFLGVSDIYVSTSLSDTTSVSLVEAMACGLPVLVTELEGNMEWVKNGMNGFLFSKGDFKALAEKIIYLLRDEDTRRRFGVINRKYVEKEGNYEKEMRKMEKLYKELVEAYRI
jgi:glycosyltransferase involved in cell wall biosynthesis